MVNILIIGPSVNSLFNFSPSSRSDDLGEKPEVVMGDNW